MRLLLVFLFALGLSSGFAQPVFPSDLGNASALGNELYEHSGATGMVLVVVHNDKVFIEGYGETAPRSHQTPTADSLLRLCSITKIFTTDVLTKMALDHTVALNDPLQKYAPAGFTVPERKQQPITLLNLATHTAGLYREVGYPPNDTPHFTYPDYAMRWNWLSRQPLRYAPGTMAAYSNVGFDLLSDALAAAAHKPYSTLLRERTLVPLRMWHTTFYPSPEQCASLLVSAQPQGPCTATANTAGSGGLYSTAGDMSHLLKYLLGTGGKDLPAQPAAAQQSYIDPGTLVRATGLNYAGTPTGLGLGWLHLLAPDDPSHLVEKDGGGAGYLTYIALHPASHTGLFVAMTIGRNGYHANLFKASNDILYKLTGAPVNGDAIGLPPAGARDRHGRLMRAARPQANARRAQAAEPQREARQSARAAGKAGGKASARRQAAEPAGKTVGRKAAHPAGKSAGKAAPRAAAKAAGKAPARAAAKTPARAAHKPAKAGAPARHKKK